jgi:hypothetical protein
MFPHTHATLRLKLFIAYVSPNPSTIFENWGRFNYVTKLYQLRYYVLHWTVYNVHGRGRCNGWLSIMQKWNKMINLIYPYKTCHFSGVIYGGRKPWVTLTVTVKQFHKWVSKWFFAYLKSVTWRMLHVHPSLKAVCKYLCSPLPAVLCLGVHYCFNTNSASCSSYSRMNTLESLQCSLLLKWNVNELFETDIIYKFMRIKITN